MALGFIYMALAYNDILVVIGAFQLVLSDQRSQRVAEATDGEAAGGLLQAIVQRHAEREPAGRAERTILVIPEDVPLVDRLVSNRRAQGTRGPGDVTIFDR